MIVNFSSFLKSNFHTLKSSGRSINPLMKHPHKDPMQKVFHLQSREFRLLFLHSGRHCVKLWLEFGCVAKLKKTNLLFLNTHKTALY